MRTPVSPVIANIYMEYFEEIALYPQCPIPTPWWKRYVDEVNSIVLKRQVDTLFNHLHSVNFSHKIHHGKLLAMMVVSHPWKLNVLPKSDPIKHTSVYRKLTHTDYYLTAILKTQFQPQNSHPCLNLES